MCNKSVIKFEKSMEQRLLDFEFLFDKENSPISKMSSYWGDELELSNVGGCEFRAIWHISEEDCKEYNTTYQLPILVQVKAVDYANLLATVMIEGVLEDTEFPETVDVLLFDILPTKEQDISQAVAYKIADNLDKLRYFYTQLWYSWDCSEDICVVDWVEQHLKPRIELSYAIMRGEIDKVTAAHFLDLKSEGEATWNTLQENNENGQLIENIRNVFRMEHIKMELSFFEDPNLRGALVACFTPDSTKYQNRVGLVMGDMTLEEISTCMALAKSLNPDERIKVFCDLQEAVDRLQTNNSILLAPGKHKLTKLSNITYGGSIKGLGDRNGTYIIPDDILQHRYFFMTTFGQVTFENLSIERQKGAILSVKDQNLRLIGCILKGNKCDGTGGVIVEPGCSLEMTDCVLSNLAFSLVVGSNASASLVGCTITDCCEGIKLKDGATVSLTDCTVKNCLSSGILLETNESVPNEQGDIAEMLKNLPCVTSSNCKFISNKVDAAIVQFPANAFESW